MEVCASSHCFSTAAVWASSPTRLARVVSKESLRADWRESCSEARDRARWRREGEREEGMEVSGTRHQYWTPRFCLLCRKGCMGLPLEARRMDLRKVLCRNDRLQLRQIHGIVFIVNWLVWSWN